MQQDRAIGLLDAMLVRWADATPEAEAFRYGGAGLNYRALDEASDRLAMWLVGQGVRRGDLVGIWQQRSLDLPVAVYGVMKAGAGYVPLDPMAPPERTGRILRDCDIQVLISDERMAPRLDEVAEAAPALKTVLGIAQTTRPALQVHPFAAIDTAPPRRLPVRDAGDKAYIIFTSGSTGVPKGITHTHASAVCYAVMAAELYGLKPGDRMGNHSPLHFDMSMFEYFAGPYAGATTVLIPEAVAAFPASLAALIEQEALSIWYSVPYALIALEERGALEGRDLSAMRWVIHAGEPMAPAILARLQAFLPNARFSNSYGPAEVNQVTYFHHEQGAVDTSGPIPIGMACPHAMLEIAEDGELLVATPAMMAGYWRRPDLNAGSFVDSPGADGRVRRFYKTGDIVRRDAQGRLLLVGRADRQIKIRGARVELDEVELALASLSAVSEAAAVASADASSVLAFVTLKPGEQADAADLTRHARQRLSPHACPRHIEIVEEFARTGTGKIDRKALRSQVNA